MVNSAGSIFLLICLENIIYKNVKTVSSLGLDAPFYQLLLTEHINLSKTGTADPQGHL